MTPQKSDEKGAQLDLVQLLNRPTASPKTGHNLANLWFDTDPDLIQHLLHWSLSDLVSRPPDSQKPTPEKLIVLDPFVGTGEVLKAARQNNVNAIGIDINPIAWFLAKTALEPVANRKLQTGLKRLADRPGISEKAIQEELYDYYRTDCPCQNPHTEKAHILKMFWIQTVICSNPMCTKRVPLFDDFIISQKRNVMPFYANVLCPNCGGVFDWDLKHTSPVSRTGLLVNSLSESSGQGRAQKQWTAGTAPVTCPYCHALVTPDIAGREPETKKITTSILFCPYCQEVWQYRGPLPENVRCPACRSGYYPKKGNIQQPDWYQCPHCGTIDKISLSLKELATEERFPVFPYAIEGFCPDCARAEWHPCLIHLNQGYFFKKVAANDLACFLATTKIWSQQQTRLEFPLTKINLSRETQPLLAGNFFYWFQLFNQRQLLSLSELLAAIRQEPDKSVRNQFLLAFLKVLEHNHLLAAFNRTQNKVTGWFETQPLAIPYRYTESNIFGFPDETGSFLFFIGQLKKQHKVISPDDQPAGEAKISLWCSSLTSLVQQNFLPAVDLILSELPTQIDARFLNGSDFYYVWLRLALKDDFSFFSQEHVHRVENINYFPRRKDDVTLYFHRIRNTLHQARGQLKPNGRMIFILPVQPEKFWASLVETFFQAGLVIDGIIPVSNPPAGKPTSARLKKMIFICRDWHTVPQQSVPDWPQFVDLIYNELIQTRQLGTEPAEIESWPELTQRYWRIGQVLSRLQPFVSSMLEAKFPMSLDRFFQLINMLQDWVSHPERNLPDELKTMDCITYLYLAHFGGCLEITSPELEGMCRGICDPDLLLENRILKRVQRKLEVNYIVIDPLDRYDYLQTRYQNLWQTFGVQAELFKLTELPRIHSGEISIDWVHLLLGKLAYGEDIQLWLGQHPQVVPRTRAIAQFWISQPVPHRDLLTKLLAQLPQSG